jgi:HK97 family phage major capsid protein
MDERLKQVLDAISELEGKAASLEEKITSGAAADGVEAVKSEVADVKSALEPLVKEKADLEQKAVISTLESEIKSLRERADAARKPGRLPFQSRANEGKSAVYGPEAATSKSFYADVKSAQMEASSASADRIKTALEGLEGKAMVEGTDSAGGFLVPPDVSSDLVRTRYTNSVLRALFSSVQVSSDEFQIPSVTGGLTAGWVAELANKPEADLTFASATTNVFTAAGLAVVSNQLLKDANWSVDQLINTDLAFRLAQLEEIAFLNGSGTGQPRGILNTAGVGTVALTSTEVIALLEAIVTGITNVYTEYKGPPDAVVMHPRTWARIAIARTEGGVGDQFLVGPGTGLGGARNATDPLPGYGQGALPVGSIFGFPVYTTPNVPTNLGAGTNESRVIVGNFKTGLILDREDITYASSEHVYFTSNRTVFRAEERVGFTAARYPKAFQVVGGAGLANG